MKNIESNEDLTSRNRQDNDEASASSSKTAAEAAFKEKEKPANTQGTQSVSSRVLAGEGGAPSSDSTPNGQQKLPIEPRRPTPVPQGDPQTESRVKPQSAPSVDAVDEQPKNTPTPDGARAGPLVGTGGVAKSETSVGEGSKSASTSAVASRNPGETTKNPGASEADLQQEARGGRRESQPQPQPQGSPSAKVAEGDVKDTPKPDGTRAGPSGGTSDVTKSETSGNGGTKPESTSAVTSKSLGEPTKVSGVTKADLQQEAEGENREPQPQPQVKPQSSPSTKGLEDKVKGMSSRDVTRSGPPTGPSSDTKLEASVGEGSKSESTSVVASSHPGEPTKNSGASKADPQQEPKGEHGGPQTHSQTKAQSSSSSKETSRPDGTRTGPTVGPSGVAKSETSGGEGSKSASTSVVASRNPGESTKNSGASKADSQQEPKGEQGDPQAKPQSSSSLKDKSDPPSGSQVSPDDEDGSNSNGKRIRRPLPKKEKRTETLKFRATSCERDEIIDNIPDGFEFSDWARTVLVGKSTKTKSEKAHRRKVIGELGRIGNNLNQIAKKINTEGLPGNPEHSLELVSKIHAIYVELQSLKGGGDAT